MEERGCGYRVKKDRISLRLKLVHLFQDDLRCLPIIQGGKVDVDGQRYVAGNTMFPGNYRVFLDGNRQTKCLSGDRQKTL